MTLTIAFCGVVAVSALPQSPSKASEWGTTVRGLHLRVSAPQSIEQRLALSMLVEIQRDPSLSEGPLLAINTYNPERFLSLNLTNVATRETLTLKANDPLQSGGPVPFPDRGEKLGVIDRNFHESWHVYFDLMNVDERLKPGGYVAQTLFSKPANDLGWGGVIASPQFTIEVLPETPKLETFRVPKRLRVVKELTTLGWEEDSPLVPIPVIKPDWEDAEEITVRVHNGYSVATVAESSAFSSKSDEPPELALNQLVGVDYKDGDLDTEIRVGIIEKIGWCRFCTGLPANGKGLLWSATFKISFGEREFQAMPVQGINAEVKGNLASLEAYSDLRNLWLVGPKITDAELRHVESMKALRQLLLAETDVSDEGLQYLQSMTQLREVTLRGNSRVTGTGLGYLRSAASLESLDLSSTRVSDSGLTALVAFPNLKTLELDDTAITDAGLATVASLTSLEKLTLSKTRITDEGLARLVALKNLKELYLNGTAVTDRGIGQLRSLPNLTQVFLRDTRVTKEGASALQGRSLYVGR
jgi:hypothetical protein